MNANRIATMIMLFASVAFAGSTNTVKEVILKDNGQDRHWVIKKGSAIVEEHYLTAHGDLHVAIEYPKGVHSPQVDADKKETNVTSRVKVYWPNGKILSDSTLPTGKDICWYQSGQVLREAEFLNEEPTGTWRFYDKTGKLIAQGVYRSGKRHSGSFIGNENVGGDFLFTIYPMKKGFYQDGKLIREEDSIANAAEVASDEANRK